MICGANSFFPGDVGFRAFMEVGVVAKKHNMV